MARIKAQSIEKVRLAADIVETISNYIEVKQRGRNHFGLCPFHNEKTPSFSINPDRQIYKCFGCGAGGGTINFIMEIENLDFPDAIIHLAQSFNVKIEYEQQQGNSKSSNLKSQLIEIHKIASDFYHKNLYLKRGIKALNYLKDRGLSDSTINKFHLGFSFDSFDDLLKLLREKSFSSEAMNASGLFIKSDKGYYNRFRSRIIFPIQDYRGNVIAFTGRIFNKDDPAKYQNSPDTPIYNKSNVLYGLFQNAQSIRQSKKIILVEGQMDLIQLYNAGINDALSISGTAFTNAHAIALKRYSNDIYIMFDGDEAGKKASLKCGYMLAQNSLLAKIITPPDNLDPDDWILRDGTEKFINAFKDSNSIIESHYNNFRIAHNGNDKINILISDTLDELSLIKDLIIQEMMIKELSELTSINQHNIMNSLNEKINKKKRFKGIEEYQTPTQNITLPINLYDDLIRLCFSDNQTIRELIFKHLDKSWLLSKEHELIFDVIYIHLKGENTPIPEIISEQLTEKNLRKKLISLVFDLENFDSTYNIIINCLQRIETTFIKTKINARREELKNNDNVNTLKELSLLEKKLSSINTKYEEQGN